MFAVAPTRTVAVVLSFLVTIPNAPDVPPVTLISVSYVPVAFLILNIFKVVSIDSTVQLLL